MARIHISDIASTELQELDLLADSENDLKDLSDMGLNNIQSEDPNPNPLVRSFGAGYPVGMTSHGYLLD
jgi:hypothetical protein